MKRPRLSHLVPQPKFRPFLGMREKPFVLLDIGCGNHSPSVTKHWFPQCQYYGLDLASYNNSAEDYSCMAGYFEEDLSESSLSAVPNGAFDVIIMAHVIEHLPNGEAVLGRLATKLKPNGRIYIEFPSEASLHLPSGHLSLNFYDDPTHVKLYTVTEVASACTASGLKVVRSGTRRDRLWLGINLLSLPVQLYSLAAHRKLFGPLLWDLLGFASFVIAENA